MVPGAGIKETTKTSPAPHTMPPSLATAANSLDFQDRVDLLHLGCINHADVKELQSLALSPDEIKQLSRLLPGDLESVHLLGHNRGQPFSPVPGNDILRFMQLALRIFKMSLVEVLGNCGSILPTFVQDLRSMLKSIGSLGEGTLLTLIKQSEQEQFRTTGLTS